MYFINTQKHLSQNFGKLDRHVGVDLHLANYLEWIKVFKSHWKHAKCQLQYNLFVKAATDINNDEKM